MSIYKAGRPWKFDPTTGAGHRPPNSPGEYRMRDGSGCITYIGETNDLARRMREHIRSGKLPTGQGCGSTLEESEAFGMAGQFQSFVARPGHGRGIRLDGEGVVDRDLDRKHW